MKVFVGLTESALALCRDRAVQGDIIISEFALDGELGGVGSWVPSKRLGNVERASISAAWCSFACATIGGSPPGYVNDVYRYVIIPLASHMAAIDSVIQAHGVKEIVLVGPPPLKVVPQYFVKSIETPYGSATLLASSLGHHLGSIEWPRPVTHMCSEGSEWYAHLRIRRSLMRLLSSLIAVRWIVRVLALRLAGCPRVQAPHRGVVILTRAEAQCRTAGAIAERFRSQKVEALCLYVPQFIQGSMRADRRMMRMLNRQFVSVPCVRSVLRNQVIAHWRAWGPRSLAGRSHAVGKWDGTGAKYRLQVRGRECIIERYLFDEDVRCLPALNASGPMLHEALKESVDEASLVLGFELYGREAVAQYMATRSAGMDLAAVQIVAVPVEPLPMFPLADRFYADTKKSAAMMQEVGGVVPEVIGFAGSPYSQGVQKVSEADFRIAYVTQPYEHHISEGIMALCAAVAEERGWGFCVRLHPRDNPRLYSENGRALISQYALGGDLDGLLEASDIIVGRTSSVLAEAIARGIPVVACMFTNSDEQFGGYYLEEVPGAEHVARDLDSVRKLVEQDPNTAWARASRRRAIMFGEVGLDGLVANIVADFGMGADVLR